VRPAFALVLRGVGEHPRAVFFQPCGALQRVEAFAQRAVQCVEMAHVVGGVVQLRCRQWPAQPVGAGFALVDRDPEEVLQHALIAQPGAHAAQRGGDLGIEQRLRQCAAEILQRDQVFAGAVHDLEDAGVGQQLRQRLGHARQQGVDQQDAVVRQRIAACDLHQRQLRPVSALADELGVHADAGRCGGDEGVQRCGVGDPVRHGLGS
jgi:hypothetical protein